MIAAQIDLNEFTPEQLREEARARSSRTSPRGLSIATRRDLFAHISDEELVAAVLRQQRIAYGPSTRVEAGAATQGERRDANAVVGVFSEECLRESSGGLELDLVSFNGWVGEHYGFPLAHSEPFRDQPLGPVCAGCLVGPDLILTVGRFFDESHLARWRFLFDFSIRPGNNPPPTRVNPEHVYRGKRIVDSEVDPLGEDWALIQVDRPVVGRTPAQLRRRGQPAQDEAMHVIGHPFGLPLKVATGATVRESTRPESFIANIDPYGGGAGAPVFNSTTHEVEGILVRGTAELVRVNDNMVSLICPEIGCLGSVCTRAPLIPLPHEKPAILRLRRPHLRGEDVRSCQRLLARQGFGVPADGVFGPLTRAAVKAFQRREGLEPSGIIDVETRTLLAC